MKKPVIIIGVGEMGGVFARGFLRQGYPVYPVTRNMNIVNIAKEIHDPALVLAAVGEQDIHATLDTLPKNWHNKLALLQNELLPRDWQAHNIEQPTVISVWFEKKKGQDYKVIIPSPVYGNHADIIASSLRAIDIACLQIQEENEMLYELVRKNIYILTTNIAGLVVGGTVEGLLTSHKDLANKIADEIIQLQQYLTGQSLPRERLITGMEEAIRGDLNHKCMGRSAPTRLARAIGLANEAKLEVPKIREIYAK